MVVPGTGGQNLLSSLWPSVLGAAHLILLAPEAPPVHDQSRDTCVISPRISA